MKKSVLHSLRNREFRNITDLESPKIEFVLLIIGLCEILLSRCPKICGETNGDLHPFERVI